VYLARDAPIGVVLRRGPSDWARLSVWRTDADTFEHGQWFRGRVYERRSDVSTDGSLFIYFARKSGGGTPANAYPHDTWVAISRPPWFTALALWFVGGTYHTGGFFPSRRSVWHGFGADPPDQGQLPRWLALSPALPPYADRTNDWPSRTVWINRLLRDGWESVPGAPVETWERRHPSQPLALIMEQSELDYRSYGGRHVLEYAVRTEAEPEARIGVGADLIPLGRATWADWDQGGRLVLARAGRLLHWQPPDTLREIADFNPQVPEPAPSPARALTWPRQPPGSR
jgi:hypothetical protein